MSDERKVQLGVAVDATSAKEGFNQIAQSGREMASDVEQSGRRAASGLGKIGDNAPQAQQKIDGATKSIIQSIERATAAMQAGTKGSAEYYEALARQRGVSFEAIKPYIDQLRQAQEAQESAARGLGKIEMTAKQTAAALRGVPAQFTDIVVALQGGQAPMTVLLQQGGQLKDMFGGVGAAARALGGYVASLVNPFSIAAAGVATLGFAYSQGAKELDAYRLALITTGNAAGTTTGQLKSYAQEIAGTIGTQGKAAESLAQLASSGKVANEVLREAAQASIAYERATGQAMGKTAESFASLAGEPLKAVLKLNDSMNFLTESAYRQIKSLEEQGRAADAAAVAQRAYAEALTSRSGEIERNLGSIERGWLRVKDMAKGAWDAMLNVGRADTNEDRLASINKQIADLERRRVQGFGETDGGAATGRATSGAIARIDAELAALGAQKAAIEGVIHAERERGKQEAENAANRKLYFDWDQKGAEFQTKAQKRDAEILRARTEGQQLVNAGLRTQAEVEERIAQIRKKYEEKPSSGAAGTGQNEVAAIRAKITETERYLTALQAQGAEAEKLTEGEKLVIKIQEELKTSISGVARAQKEKALAAAQTLASLDLQLRREKEIAQANAEAEAEYRKGLAAMAERTDAIDKQAQELEAANAAFGKSKIAIEEYTTAQKQAQLAKLQALGLQGEFTAELEREIAARKRLTEAMREAEFKAAGAKYDEAIAAAQAQNNLVREEISLIGLTEVERKKIIAAREVEIELAKELREIDNMGLDDDARAEELRIKARAKARIKAETAQNKVMLAEGQKTADEINRSLTDALLRGFESGKEFAENFRDTLKNMFNTLVLRPIISMIVQPVSLMINGAVQGGMSALGGGSSLMGMAGNASSLYSLMSGNSFINTVGGWLGLGGASSMYALGTGATGLGLTAGGGLGLTAGGGLGLTAGTGAAGAAGSGFMGALSAIPGWGWALAGIGLLGGLLGGLDDSGTPHIGGSAAWSSRNGLRTNLDFLDDQEGLPGYDPNDNIDNQFGSGMPWVQDSKEVRGALSTMAKTIGSTLDSFAKTFGGQGGFDVALGFADDSSKDGSWGAFRVSRDGEDLINWNDDRMSKWAPRIFADGEAGWKEFTAAVAQDMRDAMLEMDIPSWVKEGLEGLGDEFDIEALGNVITQVSAVNQAFEALGHSAVVFAALSDEARSALINAAGGLEGFAASAANYYDKFYSDDEKKAFKEDQLSKEMERLGLTMPKTREEFRAMVEAQLALGESGAEAAAALMGLSDAAYDVLPSAEEAGAAIRSIADLAKDQFGITADNIRGLFDDVLNNAGSRGEAERMGSDGFKDMIMSAMVDGLVGNLSNIVMSQIVTPLITSAATMSTLQTTSAAVSAATLSAGGAIGGANTAAGGSMAGEMLAQGGAAAAQAMVSGGEAVGQIVTSVIDAARQQFSNFAALMKDPEFLALLDEAGDMFGELAGDLYDFSGAIGMGGGVSATLNDATSAAGSMADALGSLVDAIEEEIKRLRGLMRSDSPGKGYEQLLAEFTTTTAAARAGDNEALEKLPGLSQQIEELALGRVSSSSELALMRGWLAGSLEETLAIVANASVKAAAEAEEKRLRELREKQAAWAEGQMYIAWEAMGKPMGGPTQELLDEWRHQKWLASINGPDYGIGKLFPPKLATGTNYVPQDMLAVIHEGEAVVPKQFNPWANGNALNGDVVEELRAVRGEIAQARLETQSQAVEAQRMRLRLARDMERVEQLLALQDDGK